MEPRHTEVTHLLGQWAAGDRQAFDRVVCLVYDELHRLASRQLARERPDHTLTPTALIHEAYLNLASIRQASFRDRAHFLAMAARAMRRLLVDRARRRGAQRRGGGIAAVTLDDQVPGALADERVLELDEAIGRLERLEPRRALVLEQHYFGGLQLEEIAAAQALSVSSVKRDLRLARAWLAAELAAPAPAEPGELR